MKRLGLTIAVFLVPILCFAVALTPSSAQATLIGNTELVAAPGAGNAVRIYRIECNNTHATVAVVVGFRFGAAGAIFGKRYLPALGGAMIHDQQYTQGGDNEALNINLSAGSTTVECTAYTETVDVS